MSTSSSGSDTLASLLKTSAVPMATLHKRYGPLLLLVESIIGVVPKCDEYLEIWPPAFRTYNIMVPNFLNLPFSIFGLGGAPADVVGLGLYVASRAAECPYCSAHTCSFALRRGASPEKVAEALLGGGSLAPPERAVIAVARSLARIPCELCPTERTELERHFSPEEAEWIVAGICMMGFLNKFMDAIGVELEPSTAAEVVSVMGAGWSAGKAGRDLDPAAPARPPPSADSLWTKLSIVPLLPFALRTDRRWQQGVPASAPEAGELLRELTGHDFPVLLRLRHPRVIQSITSMLRENLDPAASVVGVPLKVTAGVVFTSIIGDAALAAEVRSLGPKHGLDPAGLDAAASFATAALGEPPATEAKDRAALLLAKAASPSPARIDAAVVEACRSGGLTPPAIVELVSWLSVLQMLHRLSSYFATSAASAPTPLTPR